MGNRGMRTGMQAGGEGAAAAAGEAAGGALEAGVRPTLHARSRTRLRSPTTTARTERSRRWGCSLAAYFYPCPRCRDEFRTVIIVHGVNPLLLIK